MHNFAQVLERNQFYIYCLLFFLDIHKEFLLCIFVYLMFMSVCVCVLYALSELPLFIGDMSLSALHTDRCVFMYIDLTRKCDTCTLIILSILSPDNISIA